MRRQDPTFFDDNFWWQFLMTIFDGNFWWQFLMTIFDDNFWWLLLMIFFCTYFRLVTCDIWDTYYNADYWEPGFMTIFVTWHLIVTLDSIRNSWWCFLRCRCVKLSEWFFVSWFLKFLFCYDIAVWNWVLQVNLTNILNIWITYSWMWMTGIEYKRWLPDLLNLLTISLFLVVILCTANKTKIPNIRRKESPQDFPK